NMICNGGESMRGVMRSLGETLSLSGRPPFFRVEGWRFFPGNRLLRDNALCHILPLRQVKHRIEHRIFHDRPQRAGAGSPEDCLLNYRLKGRPFELELDTIQSEELLILLHEGIFRFGKDVQKSLLVKGMER